jgi:hypothetical protein
MQQFAERCIYCEKPVQHQRGEGDHVIPAALGRFEGEFRFRRICQDCNKLIGGCEEQLLRSAPEAYFRRIVNPKVKRNSRGKSWVGASKGSKPPNFTINHGDHLELVTAWTDDPRNVSPLDQLVLVDEERRQYQIRLSPEMTVSQLRAKLKAASEVVPSGKLHLHADESATPKYVALLKEIYPDRPVSEAGGFEPGTHQINGRATFTFHEDYWRAIAKIGFHYYLCNSRRGMRGDEPDFESIRRFIIEGGDRTPFFTNPTARFALPVGELPDGSAILPATWAHLLAADETDGYAVAMVSLFMGPERLAPTYHLDLGGLQSSLGVPGARWAHAYEYNTHATDDRHAGRVVTLSLRRLN